jgi:hypothetical protein
MAARNADVPSRSIVDEAGVQVKPSVRAFGKHSSLCGALGARLTSFGRELAEAELRYDKHEKPEKLLDELLKEAEEKG